MPLKRPIVAPFQRADESDFDAVGQLGLENLYLLARHAIGRGQVGILGGGKVVPDSGLFVTLESLIAADSQGRILVVEAETTQVGPFVANVSGFNRIDLLTVVYGDASSDLQNRQFIDPASGTLSTQQTPTTVTVTPAVAIKVGTPAGSPVAPTPDAGHIAIAQILVRNGAASIISSDITLVQTTRFSPVRFAVSADVGPPVNFPYQSSSIDGVVTPRGMVTRIRGELTAKVGAHSCPFFRLKIVDAANPATVFRTATYPNAGSPDAPDLTMVVSAYVIGPAGPTNYALRLERSDGVTGNIALTTVSSISIETLTLAAS